jgi:hypothetical protein
VGEAKSGESLVLLGKVGQSGDDDGKLVEEESETVSEEDQVGVAVYRSNSKQGEMGRKAI